MATGVSGLVRGRDGTGWVLLRRDADGGMGGAPGCDVGLGVGGDRARGISEAGLQTWS